MLEICIDLKEIILEKSNVINKLQNQKLNKTQHLAKQSQRNLPIPRRTFLQEAATQLAATKSRSKITAKNSSLEKTNKEDEEALFNTHFSTPSSCFFYMTF